MIAGALAIYGPILTPPGYFGFVDDRVIFGIPNFGDVVSNAPFLPVGVIGVLWTRRYAQAVGVNSAYTAALYGFFVSVAAVAFGSGYFHLAPGDLTILPDRAPIATAAGCLFAAFVIERLSLSRSEGYALLVAAVATAIVSVVITGVSGDLRLYLFGQLAPVLGGILLIVMVKLDRPGISARRIILMIALYGLAKAAEVFDQEIYDQLIYVSGHNLKHLLAAGAAACAIPRR
ncbi:MAG: hypothetical protein ACKVH0_10130 [Alphaproteobacteria bacterium]